jgi:hypothetical protein
LRVLLETRRHTRAGEEGEEGKRDGKRYRKMEGRKRRLDWGRSGVGRGGSGWLGLVRGWVGRFGWGWSRVGRVRVGRGLGVGAGWLEEGGRRKEEGGRV